MSAPAMRPRSTEGVEFMQCMTRKVLNASADSHCVTQWRSMSIYGAWLEPGERLPQGEAVPVAFATAGIANAAECSQQRAGPGATAMGRGNRRRKCRLGVGYSRSPRAQGVVREPPTGWHGRVTSDEGAAVDQCCGLRTTGDRGCRRSARRPRMTGSSLMPTFDFHAATSSGRS